MVITESVNYAKMTALEKENQKLKEDLETYQNLASENAEIMDMLQKDKDFIDLSAMYLEKMIKNTKLSSDETETMLKVIKQIRGRI